ncbi:hypothetical protein BDW22DRAFT_1352695 [Trametopsis cervina]|nr:hypothetical protein BDW22DRAFT_1352695 [Trametopsis cervina]
MAVSAVSFVLCSFTHLVLLSLATGTNGIRQLDVPSSTSTRHGSSAVFTTDHVLYQRSVEDSLSVLYAIFYSLSMVVILYALSVIRRLILKKQEYECIIEHNARVAAAWEKERERACIQAALKSIAEARKKKAEAHAKALERSAMLEAQLHVSECERVVKSVALEGVKEELREMEVQDVVLHSRLLTELVEGSRWKRRYEERQADANAQSRQEAERRETAERRHAQIQACQFVIHAITMRVQTSLEKDLADIRITNAALTARRDMLNERASSVSASLQATGTLFRTRVSVLKQRLDQRDARCAELESRLAVSTTEHETQLEECKTELSRAAARVRTRKQQLMSSQLRNIAFRTDTGKLEDQISLVNQGVEEAEEKLESAESELSTERQQHRAMRGEYLAKKQAADDSAAGITAENRDLRAQLSLATEAATLATKLQGDLEAEKEAHKQQIARRVALEGSVEFFTLERRMHMEQCSRDWAAVKDDLVDRDGIQHRLSLVSQTQVSAAADRTSALEKLQDELDAEKQSHAQDIARCVALEKTLEVSALEYKTHMEQCSLDRTEEKAERDGLEHRLALVSEGFGEAEARLQCDARELYVERQRHQATIEAYRAGQRMGDGMVDRLITEAQVLREQQPPKTEEVACLQDQDQPGVERESQAIPTKTTSFQTPLPMRFKSHVMADILRRRNLERSSSSSRNASPLSGSPASTAGPSTPSLVWSPNSSISASEAPGLQSPEPMMLGMLESKDGGMGKGIEEEADGLVL